MKTGIGGNVCVRNGFELDYCWVQAVESLLPVCDEVVVCDSDSIDGTREYAEHMAKREPKIRVINWPWPNPVGDWDWWVTWLNFSREHIKTPWHLQLDADEVLHENSYSRVLDFTRKNPNRSANFIRYNFWLDSRHCAPIGHCCAPIVTRLAPSNLWLPSDCYHPKGDRVLKIKKTTKMEICHYGFLRKREAYFRKAKVVEIAFANNYDERLKAIENVTGNWMEKLPYPEPLITFTGSHPRVIHRWLKDRGHQP